MAKEEISDQLIARWAARQVFSKKKKPSSTVEAAAEKFVTQFRAEELAGVLKDGKENINFKWCVKQLLLLLKDPDSSASVKLDVIDRMTALNKLAAVQYGGLNTYLDKTENTKSPKPKAGAFSAQKETKNTTVRIAQQAG